MKNFLFIILFFLFVILAFLLGSILAVVSEEYKKPIVKDLTIKYCTIKLNDNNKQTSYITGECIE